jgi:hypothetical protein
MAKNFRKAIGCEKLVAAARQGRQSNGKPT